MALSADGVYSHRAGWLRCLKMPESGLPADIEQFLAEYIRSIEHLEVLLVLASAPEVSWSAAEVLSRIQSSEASIRDRLEEFVTLGLVSREEGHYRFVPKSEELRVRVEEVARAYKERRIRVVQAIYSERRHAAREVSDAFRFRRKGKDG